MEETGLARMIKPLVWGIISGSGSIAVVFLVVALVISKASIPPPSVLLIVCIAGGIGGFVSGFVAARLLCHKGLLIGLACGILLCIVLIVGTLILSGSLLGGEAITKYAVILIASVLGGALGVNGRKRRR